MFSRKDLIAGAILFVASLAIFRLSHISAASDSRYTMLFAEQLLRSHTFSVDVHAIPDVQTDKAGQPRIPYQVRQQGDRYYDFYPPGNVILSLPVVALANSTGLFMTGKDGVHIQKNENRLQRNAAAFLMAVLVGVTFFTSRLMLPVKPSLLVATTTAFGTQLWSTASRAMWSQTWGVFILGFVIWLLVRAEVRKERLHPVLLATLLSWLYFVRPTFAVAIVAVAFYVLVRQRDSFLPLVLTGLCWLAGFLLFSKLVFEQLQPHYYHQYGFRFATLGQALVRNLVSPSRGLFVYVPVLFLVIYLLVRYRTGSRAGLVLLSSIVIVLHLIVISIFGRRGGHCYGPRLTTDLVPWFSLLGMIAIENWLRWRGSEEGRVALIRRRFDASAAALLIGCSVALNAIGGLSQGAWWWNIYPNNIDKYPQRLWDWKHPQFLGVPADWRSHRESEPVNPPG
jgi:hypothetical protein